jgi:hypothetical protein
MYVRAQWVPAVVACQVYAVLQLRTSKTVAQRAGSLVPGHLNTSAQQVNVQPVKVLMTGNSWAVNWCATSELYWAVSKSLSPLVLDMLGNETVHCREAQSIGRIA